MNITASPVKTNIVNTKKFQYKKSKQVPKSPKKYISPMKIKYYTKPHLSPFKTVSPMRYSSSTKTIDFNQSPQKIVSP